MNASSFIIRMIAAAGLLAGAVLPTTSHAATVGWYGNCYGENPALAISASGNTPVQVTTLDSASLTGLKGLFVGACTFATNSAVDTAVNGGMALIVHVPSGNLALPGATVSRNNIYGANVDFTAAAPFLSGPGGVLNNTTLDGGNHSNHGFVSAGLPAAAVAYATTANTGEVVTFGYLFGAGRVVGSTMPLGCYLQGGPCEPLAVNAGMKAYAANVIAWAAPSFTSCKAEGYTGSKLTVCQQICEGNLSGSALTLALRSYTTLYRETPPCAR